MTTIRELARRSGVSVATVSRVLNTPEVVSPDTRERVLRIAAETGYMRNESARTLATKKSNLIGLVWDTDHRQPGWRHPFFQEILVALKSALSSHGLHLLMLANPSDADDGMRDQHIRAVRRHNLDGVVLIDNGSHDPALLALAEDAVPCVSIDLAVAGPGTTYVTSDNEGGARAAARHLIERGHRRIATIAGPQRTAPGQQRLTGFRAELDANGIALPEEYVVGGDFYFDSGFTCMQRLLALPDPPTAVFAAGDAMAVGALRAAAAGGLRIPEDVALVGFDDIDLAALVQPALTTVAQDKPGFGTAAADALLAMLAGDPAPAAPIILPTHLVVRGTT
ncbi:LacI family transcriptional regulator [Virgisporangium aliadipatigenens]|uniref:LacI family transcriptional regulator n=1 Tax=Virgisporangium aliadipatigenens TaxID=741659 RepID=A0A8J4DVH5_9ACTN|nr:LacI family DNA-binding transcriptional regulator [Virgisporangium aliadipatigenens]GIJ51461.1 LacI family transcriptional regulator [Virgisporangium aliadipatigenens]